MSRFSNVRCRLLLKTSIELFFFPLLFSGYCHFVGPCVFSIVSGGCIQSSSMLFYVVSESSCQCVNTVFNADKSSSSLSSGPFVWVLWFTSRMVLSILWGGQHRYLFLWLGSCFRVLSQFSGSSEILFF